MGILGRAFVAGLATLALVGCYSPSLRDCKVSCASPGDCAGDQVCGSDGLCAAPELAGQCGALPSDPPIDAAPRPDATPRVDAAAPPADAREVEVDAAPPPIDAAPPPMVSLRVQVKGAGSVVVTGIGTCSSDPPQKGDCTYMVPAGVERTARAEAKPGEMFTRWNSLVCGGQSSTCTLTPVVFTSIAAQFDHMHLQVR